MNTSKLFHTVVVLGMAAVAAGAACSSTTEPTPVADGGSSGATSGGTSGGTSGLGVGDSGGAADSGKIGDGSSDAFAGWFCCG